jgi:hypothetical protein
VCRSWADADAGSADQEQLQLLLSLEGLPAEAVMSASSWLEQHGSCVASLDITYHDDTAPIFQQLPLSTAPLVHLARLEVDGPDSLVALAPALPDLAALTHLRASISLLRPEGSKPFMLPCVFSAGGVPLEAPPCLQQLCPGLKSLHLTLDYGDIVGDILCYWLDPLCDPRLPELLSPGLEQLHVHANSNDDGRSRLACADLTAAVPSLQRLTLSSITIIDPDLLLEMPQLEELDVRHSRYWADDGWSFLEEWLVDKASSDPQHLTKLTGCSLWWRERQPRIPHPVLAAAPNLRKLDIQATVALPIAWVEQLYGLSGLRQLHITLHVRMTPATDMVSALAGVSQLTCLSLEEGCGKVPRDTWAAVLPHLTQLRVLAIDEYLLKYGGVLPEAAQLTQLQCLYVHGSELAGRYGYKQTIFSDPLHPPPVSDVPDLPRSLKAVLHWTHVRALYPASPQQCPWDLPGTAHYTFCHKWRHAAEQGLVVCPRPCPHLPGVWELQQQGGAHEL